MMQLMSKHDPFSLLIPCWGLPSRDAVIQMQIASPYEPIRSNGRTYVPRQGEVVESYTTSLLNSVHLADRLKFVVLADRAEVKPPDGYSVAIVVAGKRKFKVATSTPGTFAIRDCFAAWSKADGNPISSPFLDVGPQQAYAACSGRCLLYTRMLRYDPALKPTGVNTLFLCLSFSIKAHNPAKDHTMCVQFVGRKEGISFNPGYVEEPDITALDAKWQLLFKKAQFGFDQMCTVE